MSRSIAPLVADGAGGFGFEKQAPTVSYGAYADDYLITLRRSAEAEQGDQVAVLARKDQVELDSRKPRYILTEPWVGYRFENPYDRGRIHEKK